MPLYELAGRRPSLPAEGSCWIAPDADLIGDVVLGNGASIWFGAIVRADNTPITIGARSNVQDGAVLHSDPGAPLVIGIDCTIGHRAILHGCSLGDRVLVGMGAIILNGAVIGDDCLIGAGALVTEDKVFQAGSLIIGAPAKAVRPLTPEARSALSCSATRYVANGVRYTEGLRRIDG